MEKLRTLFEIFATAREASASIAARLVFVIALREALKEELHTSTELFIAYGEKQAEYAAIWDREKRQGIALPIQEIEVFESTFRSGSAPKSGNMDILCAPPTGGTISPAEKKLLAEVIKDYREELLVAFPFSSNTSEVATMLIDSEVLGEKDALVSSYVPSAKPTYSSSDLPPCIPGYTPGVPHRSFAGCSAR